MTAQKKLLLAGGSHADIPMIKAAQALGYYVITTGNRAEDLGHATSDEYQSADYSDPEAMLQLAKSLQVDAISPCCNDFSAIACAYVAEKLGWPGFDSYETSLLIHHKDAFRDFAIAKQLPVPFAKGFDEMQLAFQGITEFDFPVIVKPVDLSGGKGISRADNLDEAKNAIENAFDSSRSKRIVIEDFIEGTNHGFTAILRDDKVIFHFTDDEHYFQNRYIVSGASSMTSVSQQCVEQLVTFSERVARMLSLVTGIFHVQFIVKENKAYVTEVCRRPPGDLYVMLVQHATGVDYPEWIVKGYLGDSCKALEHHEKKRIVTRHCIMTTQNGTVNDVRIDESISGQILCKMLWWKKGDLIENFMVDKLGIVFIEYQTESEFQEKVNILPELIHVEFA